MTYLIIGLIFALQNWLLHVYTTDYSAQKMFAKFILMLFTWPIYGIYVIYKAFMQL